MNPWCCSPTSSARPGTCAGCSPPARSTPRILHQTSQVFTILEYIRHQAALGFLSEEFAQDEKNLVAIPVKQIATGHVNFVWNRDPDQFPALKRFLEFVENRWPR